MSKLVFVRFPNDIATEVLRELSSEEYGNEKLNEKLALIKGNKVSYFDFPEESERYWIQQFINREFKI